MAMNDNGTIWERDNQTDYTQPEQKEHKSFNWLFFSSFMFILIIGAVLIGMAAMGEGMYVHVGVNEWVIVQSIQGDISVLEEPGIHLVWFATCWHYPRYERVHFGMVNPIFNDGKSRGVSGVATIALPTDAKMRESLHIKMSGEVSNIHKLVEHVASNLIRMTAPIMSGDDVIGAYKHQFGEYVYDQAIGGIYMYRQVESEDGMLTEVVMDENNKPVRSGVPILPAFGITLKDLSISHILVPADERAAAKAKWIVGQEILKAKMEKEYAEALVEKQLARSEAIIQEIVTDWEIEKAKKKVEEERKQMEDKIALPEK